MNRPGTQTRAAGFPPQPSSGIRNSSGPSNPLMSRMPNGKLGSAGWAFAPSQPQQTASSMAAFGQALGNSSQPATPFDISEFPVLGAGSAHQNAAQGWGRTSTQSPSQSQGRQSQDEMYQNASHVMDEFSIQRANGPSQGASSRNPRLQSSEDFPALPSSATLGGDGLSDRKGSFLLGSQSLQSGSHLDLLSPQEQQRQAFLSGPLGSAGLQTSIGRQTGSGMSNRSQALNAAAQQQQMRLSPGIIDQQHHQSLQAVEPNTDRKAKSGSTSIAPPPGTAPLTTASTPMSQNPNNRQQMLMQQTASSIAALTSQPDQQHDPQPPRYSSTPPDTEPSESSGPSDIDRYGLNGLLPLIRNEDLDMALLALGTDLTQLGLELNQPEQPLSSTFASPWSDQQVRAAEPDFKLPPCYSVMNTQPLQSKVRNFSDETLFYIFYTMPRDVMQEIVAQELTQRNWRYHKELQVWLTKVPGNEPSQIVQGRFEKGIYVFFEPQSWERQQKEFVLEYAALDQSRMNLP